MNIEKEVSKPIFKATLLAISLFIMMPSVISPALPLMEKAFPNIPRVTVELLTTIPNFGEIFGLLINPFLVKKSNFNWTSSSWNLWNFTSNC